MILLMKREVYSMGHAMKKVLKIICFATIAKQNYECKRQLQNMIEKV